jgi:uncharacterized protein YegP (UPF0339 family)
MRFQIYKGLDEQLYYWRLVDKNSQLIAISGEGCVSRAATRSAIQNLAESVILEMEIDNLPVDDVDE